MLLSIAIVTGAGFFLFGLQNRVLAENERNISNTTLILARQIENIFTTVEGVQKAIIDQFSALGIIETLDHEHPLSRYDLHLKLRDNAVGMPHVGSLTIVNAQGRVVNFSRQWPIPDIDVTDRDFFKALQSDPNLTSFISEPIRNRATGTWVIHLARKISGPNKEFLGLITAAIELDSLQSAFNEITLEPDSGIRLLRLDGTILRVFPGLTPIRASFSNRNSSYARVRHWPRRRYEQGDDFGEIHMIVAHRLDSYPIVVSVGKPIVQCSPIGANGCIRHRYIHPDHCLIAAFAFLLIRMIRITGPREGAGRAGKSRATSAAISAIRRGREQYVPGPADV